MGKISIIDKILIEKREKMGLAETVK